MPPPPDDHARVSLSPDLEKHIVRFEKAWQANQPPRLIDYLPDGDDCAALRARIAVLKELIKIDLEFCWRSSSEARTPSKRRLLEDYLANHPELQQLGEVPLDLIVEEYRVRQRWGDRPGHAEYSERFSGHADTLLPSLGQVDAELAVEFSKRPTPKFPPALANTQDQPTAQPEGAAQDSTIDSDDNPAGKEGVRQDAALPNIAGYDILEVLGRGGMGVVYQARHRKLKRLVALKMIVAGAHASPDQLARFQAEAVAVAHLQHPNIVQIHEVGEQEGLPFFCLEFVSGGSLDRTLLGTPQNPRAAAELVRTLARAMQEAHNAGIIHRDLKPANVLLAKDGTPKITDFGLAKQLDSAAGQTQSGAIMGTPSYMAPEQAAGKIKEIVPATDVYALGAILYEMVTGRPPFKAATPMDTVMQVITEEPVPPMRLQPKLPRDLDTICMKCLHKEPHKRYVSGNALADDLQHFLAGEPIQARPVGTPERLWRWCRRKPALAAASAVAVFGVMLALVTFATAFFVISESLDQEQKQRVKAENLASDNDGLAKKETNARRNAETRRAEAEKLAAAYELLAAKETKARLEAETFALRVRVEHYFSKAEDRPDVALVGMASLLPTAARLKDQSVTELLRLHVGTLSGRPTRLNAIYGHPTPVKAVALSADGKTALTGSADDTAQLWETATGQPIGPPLQHPGWVIGVALSADGKRALTRSAGAHYTAQLWETATGQPIGPPLRHLRQIRAIALSADGMTALTGSDDRTAQVWDAATGKPIGPPLQHQGYVVAVALSSDGKTALTGSYDKTARLWEAATGNPIGRPLQHQGVISAVALSADGTTSLTGSYDRTARLWESATGKLIGIPLLHQHFVNAVALSADGKTALTGSNDNTARLWNAATSKPIGTPLLHQDKVAVVALSADGTTVLTGIDGQTAQLWEAATGKPIGPPLLHQDNVVAVALSADGKLALTGSRDKTARLWKTTDKPPSPPLQHPKIAAVALSADGKTALTGGYDKTARLWETATGKPIGPPLEHHREVLGVALSGDGATALIGTGDAIARLWETATGKPIGPPVKHQGSVVAVALSTNGKTALTASTDTRAALLWETATGEQTSPPLQHEHNVLAVALSADGRTALTGSRDKTARLWETATGKPIGPPLPHQGAVVAVALSGDGTIALTASADNAARLWTTATGQPIGPPLLHQHFVKAVALSADGKTALTGSDDKTARLWETTTGKPIGSPLQHQDRVVAVALSADGKTALTGSDDKTARLWKVPQPMRGDPERIILWTQVITGFKVDALTAIRVLDAATWQQRRQRLQEIGGPLEH